MLLVEPNAGGWGASNDHDGAEGLVCVGDGETYILPVEVTETVYDILVDQYAYHITEGGEGKYRGGRGLIRDYRIVGSDDAILSTTFTRHRTPPWGVNGGRPGTTNMVEIHRREGVVSQRAGKITRTRLRLGDVARLITGTSGGWGDPRDRALIRAVDALHDDADISERLWNELASLFTEAHLLDLLLLCGWYHAISFVATAVRVPLEAGAPTFASLSQAAAGAA